MGNALQFSGQADITLRAFVDCSINKKRYVENQPVATFTANADVTYRPNTTEGRDINTRLIHHEAIPEFALIYNVMGSDELYNLLGVDIKEDKGSLPKEEEQVSTSDGYIYLNKNIDINKEYFIYDENNDLVDTITYNESLNRFENADADSNYLINYYYEREEISAYSLGNTTLPLLKMELLFKGNINKQTGYMLITIPKCRLMDTPDLSVTFQSTNSQQLLFGIVSDKKGTLSPTVKFYY